MSNDAIDYPYLHAFEPRPVRPIDVTDAEVAAMASESDRGLLAAHRRAAGDRDAQARIEGHDPGALVRARHQEQAAAARNLQAAMKANQAQVYDEYHAAIVAGDTAKAARIAAANPGAIERGHQLDEATTAEREARALADLPKAGRLREYRALLQQGKPHLAAQFRAIHRTRITDAETRLARVLKGR